MSKKNSTIFFYFLFLFIGIILGGIIGTEYYLYINSSPHSLIHGILKNANKPEIDSIVGKENGNTAPNHKGLIHDTIYTQRRNAIVIATEKVEPSVVGIVVTQIKLVSSSFYYEDFFDLFFAPRLVPKYREVQNMGSGFIIDEKGLILTNNHVVEGAEKLYINFPDGRQLEGRIIGVDPISDIAVVEALGSGFKKVQFGNSNSLLIGEWVIAIGNPFLNFFNDAQPTVTVGVISALNRNFAPSENVYYQNMIQTDAAINPGNSGGPLINALGEVIGINAFIYTGNTKNRGSIGIGFAIPINTAKRIAYELVTYGKRRNVWTGISVQDVDRSIALSLGIQATNGVIITSIEPGSPGAKASLKINDIIYKLGKRTIMSHMDLDGFFVNYFPADTIQVAIARGGKNIKKVLVLEEYKR